MSQRYLNGTGVDTVVLVDATSANETVALPGSFAVGRRFTVRRTDSSAYTVTVDPATGDYLDGVLDATTTIPVNGESSFVPLESGHWESFTGGSPVVLRGAGTPEAAVAAPVGFMYLRSDGGTSTTLYVKESGAGNTGWVAK